MTKYAFFQAHPDDLEIGCGQLMYHLGVRSKGIHEIRIVSVTKGEFGLPGSQYDRFKGDFLAEIRTQELRSSAAILNVPPENLDFLGYTDGLVPLDRRFVGVVRDYLENHRPDVVFAPDGLYTWYYHRDHVNTGRAVFYVVNKKLLDYQPRLYFYSTLSPNVFFPFRREDLELTDRLIACHKTQIWLLHWMKHIIRPTALFAGLQARGWRYAEPYREVYFGDDSRERNEAGFPIRVFTHFFSGMPFFQAKYPQEVLQKLKSERSPKS